MFLAKLRYYAYVHTDRHAYQACRLKHINLSVRTAIGTKSFQKRSPTPSQQRSSRRRSSKGLLNSRCLSRSLIRYTSKGFLNIPCLSRRQIRYSSKSLLNNPCLSRSLIRYSSKGLSMPMSRSPSVLSKVRHYRTYDIYSPSIGLTGLNSSILEMQHFSKSPFSLTASSVTFSS